jgi:hypothetical protein
MGEIGPDRADPGALDRRVMGVEKNTLFLFYSIMSAGGQMIGRSIATTILLLLAFGAVFTDALGIGYPTGALLLICAALTWSYWGTISEGFRSAKDESNVPILRMGAKIIGGMEFLRHGSPRRRSNSASGS